MVTLYILTKFVGQKATDSKSLIMIVNFFFMRARLKLVAVLSIMEGVHHVQLLEYGLLKQKQLPKFWSIRFFQFS